jgi:hypothetical protein
MTLLSVRLMKTLVPLSYFAFLAIVVLSATGCSGDPPIDQTRFALPENAQKTMLQLAESLNKTRRDAIKTLEVELQASVESGRQDDAKAIEEQISSLEGEMFIEVFLAGGEPKDFSLEDRSSPAPTQQTNLSLPENAQKITVQLAETLNKTRRDAIKALEIQLQSAMENGRQGDAKAIKEQISSLEGAIFISTL